MAGTLLLADDSITIQKVVELTFAETDHKVIAVGSGRDLFRRLPEIKPDVVLCDVVMPDMNGYEVCQSLKSDPATLHIPVVLLTGTFEPFDRDRALAAGCDAIVTKPFEARDLINLVEDLLKRVQAVAATPPPAESVGPGETGIPEGVQALDYSSTGFDRMVPPPPVEAGPPDDGIELTASSLGDSHPKAAAVVPPELQEEAAGPAPPVGPSAYPHPVTAPTFVAAPPSPNHASVGSTPGAGTAPTLGSEEETHPRPRPTAPDRFPVAEEEPGFPVEAPTEPAPFTEMTPFAAVMPPVATRPPGPVEGGVPVVSVSDDALFTAPAPLRSEKQAQVPLAPSERVAEAPAVVETPPAPAREPGPLPVQPAASASETPATTEGGGVALSDADIERVVRRVLELSPGVAARGSPAPELGDEQLERLARRVAELAAAKIERIAWEVVPDMAEMLVRKRIADLEKASEEEN